MNYDKMSVEELLPRYNWVIINATLGKMVETTAIRQGNELFAAIKKAIIREASAGLCYAMPSHPHDADEKTTTLATTYRLLPGAYELIPKEVV